LGTAVSDVGAGVGFRCKQKKMKRVSRPGSVKGFRYPGALVHGDTQGVKNGGAAGPTPLWGNKGGRHRSPVHDRGTANREIKVKLGGGMSVNLESARAQRRSTWGDTKGQPGGQIGSASRVPWPGRLVKGTALK